MVYVPHTYFILFARRAREGRCLGNSTQHLGGQGWFLDPFPPSLCLIPWAALLLRLYLAHKHSKVALRLFFSMPSLWGSFSYPSGIK